MDAASFIANIDSLLTEGKLDAVDRNMDELDPYLFEAEQAIDLVKLLQSRRQFAAVEKAASVFAGGGIADATLRRHWALSLIELDRIPQALSIAQGAIPRIDAGDTEHSEMLGVLGRGHKQQFVNTGDHEELRSAITAYEKGWQSPAGGQDWHGINLVALLARAERDGITTPSGQAPKEIASNIIAAVQANSDREHWDLANAMEASLLVGTPEQTLQWAKAYVSHAGTDAFAIGATLRQLREIWQFEKTPIGHALEPVLDFELLLRPGGSMSVEPNDSMSDTSGFEAVYGAESFTHIQWLENLFGMLNSVARIRNQRTGQPIGTGFLIDGKTIDESLAGNRFLVTNAHVVSDDPIDEAAVEPHNAVAEFTRLAGQPKIELGGKLRHSPRSDLDVWICEIDVAGQCEPLPVTLYSPASSKGDSAPERIFVVGHPSGGDLVVSLFNNELVGYEGPYVHYKSPTKGGSSGSPVLSKDLQVFAVHHRTRSDIRANEGVLFEHIVGATS